MSALFKSMDETLSAIKDQHAEEMKACQDRMLAAEVRAEILQDHLKAAQADRDSAVRIATKLITQFALVEKVFAEAKQLALEVAREGQKHEQQVQGIAVSERVSQLPQNQFTTPVSTFTEASTDGPNNPE